MPPDRPSSDFGRKLREARERRGISIRQISASTKISLVALEALEQNDLARLPGGIFSRAFVRSYAIEVGLDPDATVREFLEQFPQEPAPGTAPAADGARHAAAELPRTARYQAPQFEDGEALESERRMASTFLRLIFLSIPIAGIVLYYATRGMHPPQAAPEVETPRSEAVESVAAPPSPEAAVPEPPHTEQAVVPAATPARPSSAEVFTVGLLATGPCWVSASVDGERVVERLMQPGEQQTIEVRGNLVLTAGDPSALTVRLNGAETRPLGKPGQVATARMNATNFRSFLTPR